MATTDDAFFPKPPKRRDPKGRTRPVQYLLATTQEEKEELDSYVRMTTLSRTDFFLLLARGCRYVEKHDPHYLHLLRGLETQIAREGNNLNQLTARIHRLAKRRMDDEIVGVLADLDKTLEEVRDSLSSLRAIIEKEYR